MRTVGVATVARSDYGIYLPILRRIARTPDLRPALFVSGMHLSPEFGNTVATIEADGFPIAERIEMLLSSDAPEGTAKSVGLGIIGFAQALARSRPDLLLVLGDRFEMFAAAAAAVPLGIPIVHIHGGERTEGAMDEVLRHAITKMSHLHFAATEEYARRIIRMGEEPWRVTASGAPGLDHLRETPLLDRETLCARGFPEVCGDAPFLLVTYHPVTLEPDQAETQVEALLGALEATGMPLIITYPNADARGRAVLERLRAFAGRCARARLVDNLGTPIYFSLMQYAAGMVGNSSSGIIEAASFGLPVVNIGTRQHGRTRARNVIDVGGAQAEIAAGIAAATAPAFRAGLADLVNPYGDGRASERIVERLRGMTLDDGLLRKRFYDGDADSRGTRERAGDS